MINFVWVGVLANRTSATNCTSRNNKCFHRHIHSVFNTYQFSIMGLSKQRAVVGLFDSALIYSFVRYCHF